MDLFKYFPKEYYNLDSNKNSLEVVTNITKRFTITAEVKTNAVAYYDYILSDGETPENLAHKIYGNANKHWIVLMMNDIVDPQSDWPKEVSTLNRFIEKKYAVEANGAPVISWSKSNISGYYKSMKRTNVNTSFFRREVIEVDANTYANIVNSSTTVTLYSGDDIVYDIEKFTESYYEYEVRVNEKRRNIKILKNEYVDSVMRELEGIFEQ